MKTIAAMKRLRRKGVRALCDNLRGLFLLVLAMACAVVAAVQVKTGMSARNTRTTAKKVTCVVPRQMMLRGVVRSSRTWVKLTLILLSACLCQQCPKLNGHDMFFTVFAPHVLDFAGMVGSPNGYSCKLPS